MKLWLRRATITIGTKQFTEDLRFKFVVKKTLKPDPNTAEVQLWNLAPEMLRYFAENEALPVRIDAGYEEGMSTLFLGEMRTGETERKGDDDVSTLFCGDSEKGLRTARVSKSFKPGTPPDAILKEVARALGVGEGNVSQAVARIKVAGIAKAFSGGTVLLGSAAQEMSSVCTGMGLSWSVQDRKLQILELGKALADTAIEVATIPENTGVHDVAVDNKGKLTATLFMIQDVFPGRKMIVRSVHHQGQYIVQQTVATGDTSDDGDWKIEVEGKRY